MRGPIQQHYLTSGTSFDRPRQGVQDAWGTLGQHYLKQATEFMPDRCKVFIVANELSIPF